MTEQDSGSGIRAARQWGPVPPAPGGRGWDSFMELALDQARKGLAAGEVPVGAVLIGPDGAVLGAAHNEPCARHDPSAHAEVLALRRSGMALGNYRLAGCVLAVTLEPCLMCVGALVHARIAGVVYGALDSKAGAVSSCLNGLDLPFHNHAVWHMGGVRAQACARLLETFFRDRRSG